MKKILEKSGRSQGILSGEKRGNPAMSQKWYVALCVKSGLILNPRFMWLKRFFYIKLSVRTLGWLHDTIRHVDCDQQVNHNLKWRGSWLNNTYLVLDVFLQCCCWSWFLWQWRRAQGGFTVCQSGNRRWQYDTHDENTGEESLQKTRTLFMPWTTVTTCTCVRAYMYQFHFGSWTIGIINRWWHRF